MTLALTLSRAQLPLASPTAGRRAHAAAAVLALDHTSSLAAAVARAVVVPPGHPTDTLCLCCSRHPSASRAAIDATPECVASARACVRNGGRGVWRAPQKRPRPLLPPPRQPPLLPGQTSIDVPLSGPKRQKSSEKGRARSTRGADGRQTLPAPQLIVAALAHAPIAPIVSLERRGIAIL